MSDRKTPRYASDLMAGQVALVTGSGSGMGRATALEMASCGAKLEPRNAQKKKKRGHPFGSEM